MSVLASRIEGGSNSRIFVAPRTLRISDAKSLVQYFAALECNSPTTTTDVLRGYIDLACLIGYSYGVFANS